jgi:hypothetical protein
VLEAILLESSKLSVTVAGAMAKTKDHINIAVITTTAIVNQTFLE